jgi:hypothetical protein
MEPRQRMFPSRGMVRRSHHVPPPIPSLIALEMIELLRSTIRQRPMIPMVRIEPVVHMPMEPARPMEPRPGPKKHATHKPIRPIVPIRRAIIRRIVEVPIRARRLHPDPNRNL